MGWTAEQLKNRLLNPNVWLEFTGKCEDYTVIELTTVFSTETPRWSRSGERIESRNRYFYVSQCIRRRRYSGPKIRRERFLAELDCCKEETDQRILSSAPQRRKRMRFGQATTNRTDGLVVVLKVGRRSDQPQFEGEAIVAPHWVKWRRLGWRGRFRRSHFARRSRPPQKVLWRRSALWALSIAAHIFWIFEGSVGHAEEGGRNSVNQSIYWMQ